MNLYAGLLLPALAVAVMFFATMKNITAWEARGYDARKIAWKKTAIISALVGYAMGAGSFLLGSDSNALVSTTLAFGGYLMVFASTTDIMLLKIPSETTTVATIAGSLLFLYSLPNLVPENYMSIAFWAIFIVTMKIFTFIRWLGDGDDKIIVAFFFLYSWWMPPTDFSLGIIVITILGLLTSFVAKFFNLGVKKKVSETSKWNPETGKMEAAPLEVHEVEKDTKKKSKEKNFFPFGPAILIGFSLTALYSSFASYLPPF